MSINIPAPFKGTTEQAKANFKTHRFGNDDDFRCGDCDCKPWHTASAYPCGEEPPRIFVTE
jgi:hypothetical protein